MTAWQIAGFLACVAVATFFQNLTGFALALILLGLTGLFELAPLPDVANVATVLALVNAMVALRGTRRSIDWPMLRATAVGTVIGVPAGVTALTWLNANVVSGLRLLLGVVVIACAVVVLRQGQPLAQRSSRASFHATGLLSGLLAGMFSAAGPPLVYQFYRQPMALAALRDTLIATLAVGSALRLAVVVPGGQFSARSLTLSLLAAPLVIVVSAWLRRYPPRWPRAHVLKAVFALLLFTGLGLIGPALRSIAAARQVG